VVARAPVFDEHFKEDSPFPDNNVTHIPRASDDDIIHLMNSHQFHIIPSMYEGFGHVIHEALGCGGLVLTTDAPPMNTYGGVLKEGLVPVSNQIPRSLAQLNVVSPQAVHEAVRKVLYMTGNMTAYTDVGLKISTPSFNVDERSLLARGAFLANREFFRTTFMSLINGR
jgi:hypothetical protein